MIWIATVFITTTVHAAIFPVNVFLRKIVSSKIVVGTIFLARFGCGDSAGFAGRGAEIRQNLLGLNLTLAQCGQIVGYRLFFIQSDLAGVSANKTFIEDAAGKLVKVFVLEGAQHAGADLGGAGDGIEGDATLLALLAKFFSERSQGPTPAGGVKFPSASRRK
jgi:hypothetical protein